MLDVEPGKDAIIDNSHVVCWDSTLRYEISITTGTSALAPAPGDTGEGGRGTARAEVRTSPPSAPASTWPAVWSILSVGLRWAKGLGAPVGDPCSGFTILVEEHTATQFRFGPGGVIEVIPGTSVST